jgi:peptide/nickel transport system permease protein
MVEAAMDMSTGSAEAEKSRGFFSDLIIRMFKEKPMGTVGAVIVLLLLLTGIFAEVLAPFGMNESFLLDRLEPPSGKYLLGTDNLGRDLLSRIIFGARISMIVGLVGSGLAALTAAVIGIISAYFGRKTDMAIQRFVDAWMCFPPVFIYLSIMALLGPGLVQVVIVLGLARGIRQSRVVRGAVFGIKENTYIEAARSNGCRPARILYKHILPNVMAPIITIFAVGCGYMIISEATLSFLGFGVPPPTPSWGNMLSGPGRQYMYDATWMAMWPGIALAVAVYGLNMFGDAVRDLLDPRLRGGLGRYSGVKRKRAKTERKK